MTSSSSAVIAATAAAVLCCFVNAADAQTPTPTLFQADVNVYNDPGMLGGVSGKMYYRKAQSPNIQRIDYDVVGAGYAKVCSPSLPRHRRRPHDCFFAFVF
jgi:hypothetical protein